jgi:hypothetical protein
MATQRLTVPEIGALEREPNDFRWDLPAVAFMHDGSEVRLAGRTLRQANDEMMRNGDDDVWWVPSTRPPLRTSVLSCQRDRSAET